MTQNLTFSHENVKNIFLDHLKQMSNFLSPCDIYCQGAKKYLYSYIVSSISKPIVPEQSFVCCPRGPSIESTYLELS